MLYFSELTNIPVLNSKGTIIGSLDDLIFSYERIPHIKKLVIKKPRSGIIDFKELLGKKEKFVVSIDDVQRLDAREVILAPDFKKIETNGENVLLENELYIKDNLLNTQVIDIEENNIVRVNDVLIQRINAHGFIIDGVDIGISGVLRWLSLERQLRKLARLFGASVPQSSLAWSDIQPLELTRGRVVVKSRFTRIKKLHPADLADYLETQNFKNVLALIEGIDKEYLADVMSELNPNFQINLLSQMSIEKITPIISYMDPDDAVDVISQFPKKKRDEVVDRLPKKEAGQIKKLLKFSGNPLGDLINSEFLVVFPEQITRDVIKKIREETLGFSLFHNIYVVSSGGQLIGVFNLQELLLQKEDAPVFKFMTQRIYVANLQTPVDVAFRRMLKYKITSIPVVDEKKKIIGIISVDDIAEEMLKKI